MRDLILFLILISFVIYPQSWIRQDDGINEDINSIHFTNALNGYFAGTSGVVYRTSDGGNSWDRIVTGQNGTINGINSNSRGVWAVGDNGLLIFSSDNGSTWAQQTVGATTRFNSISFHENIGLIAGDGGTIFRTTDSGENWSLISLPVSVLRSVSIYGDNAVVVGGEVNLTETMYIAVSSNAGLTWQVIMNSTGPTLTSVQMVSPTVVYAVGINGIAAKSTDSGQIWNYVYSYTEQWLYGLHFLDANTGFLCGGNTGSGIILKTTDGGNSFTQEVPIGSRWLYSIYIHKESIGFCAGAAGGKLYRLGGDAAWLEQPTNTSSTLNDVSFYDNYVGVSVGDAGVILTTSSGGDSWHFANSPINSRLNSVDRFDTVVVAVGDAGQVLRSFGNGSSWQQSNTPITDELLTVDMISPTAGFAGGRNGKLLKTHDGGLTWLAITSPTTMTIRGMSFISESVGFITGGDFIGGPAGTGFVYRTTNGGESWQVSLSGIPLMNAISAMETQKLYVVGIKGYAFYSYTGGLSWDFMNLNTSQWLYAIDFLTDDIGYVSGGNVATGMVWMTADAGFNWSTIPLSSAQWLYGIDVLQSKVYTCGYNGKMLRGIRGIIPVELTSFSANLISQNEVELTWMTQTETNNHGFDIERDRGQGWEKIGFVSGAGTSTIPQTYSFKDREIQFGNVILIKYRLIQRDYDGEVEYSDVVEVNLPGTESFTLLQNYPNPFNPETNISFTLPQASQVTMILYDILGTKVQDITDEFYGPGFHTLHLNVVNLPSGIYFYEMRAGNFREVKRMNLLK